MIIRKCFCQWENTLITIKAVLKSCDDWPSLLNQVRISKLSPFTYWTGDLPRTHRTWWWPDLFSKDLPIVTGDWAGRNLLDSYSTTQSSFQFIKISLLDWVINYCWLSLQSNLFNMAPGVNFINILCTAFTLVDPKSIKKIDNLNVFLTLLGSGCVKAVHRTLMKFSSGVNFTCFTHSFFCRSQKHKNTVKSSVSFYAFGIYECKSCT